MFHKKKLKVSKRRTNSTQKFLEQSIHICVRDWYVDASEKKALISLIKRNKFRKVMLVAKEMEKNNRDIIFKRLIARGKKCANRCSDRIYF